MCKVRNVTKTTVHFVQYCTYSVYHTLYYIQHGTFREENEELQSGAKWYKVVHASATTGQHVANRSLPPSPHLLLLLVHTTQNMHKQICLNYIQVTNMFPIIG